MIPQTTGALLAFLALVAPGLTFEILRERKRVPAEASTFREISRVALSSLAFSAAAVVILGLLQSWRDDLFVNPGDWLQQGNGYLKQHPTLIAISFCVELAIACGTATVAHFVLFLFGRGKGSISNENSWFEALRADVPKGALPWVHVKLKDGVSFFGYCRSYTPAGKPDEREIALEGINMVRVDGPGGGEARIGEKWERVVIPGSQIAYIRVAYQSNEGQVLSKRRSRVMRDLEKEDRKQRQAENLVPSDSDSSVSH